mmetsp:Transcript_1513/g.4555  ORF Transcript_1513/g.4555 Transcript_1513/m.4555 type:complete len:236 (+) Transcript_1513:1406-2113(+)
MSIGRLSIGFFGSVLLSVEDELFSLGHTSGSCTKSSGLVSDLVSHRLGLESRHPLSVIHVEHARCDVGVVLEYTRIHAGVVSVECALLFGGESGLGLFRVDHLDVLLKLSLVLEHWVHRARVAEDNSLGGRGAMGTWKSWDSSKELELVDLHLVVLVVHELLRLGALSVLGVEDGLDLVHVVRRSDDRLRWKADRLSWKAQHGVELDELVLREAVEEVGEAGAWFGLELRRRPER